MKDNKHVDAPLHVQGRSEYLDDVPPPTGMLHAQIFDSPIAHGRLKGLNVAPALAVDGVVAVLTAADVPGSNIIGPIIQDEMLFADEKVSYIGQPIALVIATTVEQARKALRCIEVDIEQLPAVVDPREAFANGEIIDHGRTFACGDVDAAWDQCDVIVEGQCDIGGQEHLYLETNRARALPGEDGTVQVFASTQSPYATQKTVAGVLGVREHKVEIDVLRLGGGFGGKEDQASQFSAMVALAATRLHRAVELVLHRMDDIRITGKRHPYKCDYKLGVKKDGKIVAYEVKHFQNSGAFADLSTAVLERTLFHSTNAYRVPNARIFAVCCRTNLPPNTAFRGFGGPQGMFVIEAALARAAEVLNMPREELQYNNLLREGDAFPYAQEADDCHAIRTWDVLADDYKLAGMRAEVEAYNRDNQASKMGLAVMPVCFGISFTKTFLNQAGALVLIYADGSVSVANGGVEMGQGNSSKIRDVAAASLGIHVDRVRCESTNTRRVANMSPSAASATSDLNGYATLDATGKILHRLRAFAADQLKVNDVARISIRDEQVLIGDEDSGWDWQKLVQQAYFNRIDLCAHGFFSTPHIYFNHDTETGIPFAYHTYGAAAIQVRLDGLRGIYDIEKIRLVHDVGRPLNYTVDIGQIEGGLAQGLGWMSMEDLRFNDEGRYLSNTLSTYKVPDVYFMPDDMQVKILDNADNPHGPLGSKAVGEPPLMYGIGLFFAVRDAMRALRPGVDLPCDSPLTPERVLLQLHPQALAEIRKDYAAAPVPS